LSGSKGLPQYVGFGSSKRLHAKIKEISIVEDLLTPRPD
jgi:hypothetical protein